MVKIIDFPINQRTNDNSLKEATRLLIKSLNIPNSVVHALSTKDGFRIVVDVKYPETEA